MAVYLVAYDVHPKDGSEDEKNKAASRRVAIRSQIEKLSTCPKLPVSESSYVVETSNRTTDLEEGVWKLTEFQDEFYIIPLAGPVRGQGSTLEWLTTRLRR